MKLPEAGVLFVGEYQALSASVARVLNSAGCEVRCAASCQEALALLQERRYRVVLSKSKLADGNPRQLIPATQAADGWLFLSFPVEDGCWWIPLMEEGQLCMEAVALHSREFSQVLLKIVKAIQPAPREAVQESSTSLADMPARAAYAAGSY
ncbi:MAG: hypothetical protein ACRD3S_10150 [Terracidiphilus sp.]